MNRRLIRSSRRGTSVLALLLIWALAAAGCARLPYTTKTIHEDQRVVVAVQRDVQPQTYSHPVQLTSADLTSLLRGFSIREQQRVPLRWFAEEQPPKPLFREDDLHALAPYLAEGFQHVGPNDRVHFEVRNPGFNPAYGRDTIAGWMAVRDPYLYLTIEYFHTQIPVRKADDYDTNYPLTPPTPKEYILYFEPGRFYASDEKRVPAVDFRQFLKSGEAGATAPR